MPFSTTWECVVNSCGTVTRRVCEGQLNWQQLGVQGSAFAKDSVYVQTEPICSPHWKPSPDCWNARVPDACNDRPNLNKYWAGSEPVINNELDDCSIIF